MTVLQVDNLVKKFGNKEVLRGVTFNLEEGRVLGILGPNGQGKTTLLNIISGLLKPTLGSVKIEGIDVSYETKNIVSFLQEKNVIYKWMKIKDSINFYRDFFPDFNKDKMNKFLRVMKLDENMKVNTLSKGMLEKLALSIALSRKAKLYILDEPISGVDPVTREIGRAHV